MSRIAGSFFTTEPSGKPNSYNRSPLYISMSVCLTVSAVGTTSLENLD